MICSSGPPCVPGNTALLKLYFLFASSVAKIKPPRGPLNVLCVVEVTTSAYGTGDGCKPAATNPAICAMSTQSTAPHLSAISLKRLKSMILGYAEAPAQIIFGLHSMAFFSTSS